MKTICIYHSNCLDGFASAFIIWKTLGPKVEFIPAVYGKEPPWELLADSEVYIVDFSYPADIMAKICEQAHYVTVIDHHESAIRKLAGFSAENYTAKFDITRAGTELTHEFFCQERKLPQILQMLANRDLWNFSISGTKEVCAAMWEEDRTFERWDDLIYNMPSFYAVADLMVFGAKIIAMNARNIENLLRSGTRQVPGTTIPICNMPYIYASEAGNILAQGHPFSITYFDRSDCRQYSLRVADGDFNVAKLAEMYGGGGHKKAAGFTASLASVSDGVPLGFAHSIAISQTKRRNDMDHLIDDSDRLMPCPFCGAEAEIITLAGETDEPSIGAQCVQCTSSACGAASGLIYPLMDDVTDLLRERWNKRHNAGLGGFFTEAMLAAASLDGEQEGRAYRGYCPKCGNHTLKIVHRDHGIAAKACNACGVLVVLKDA